MGGNGTIGYGRFKEINDSLKKLHNPVRIDEIDLGSGACRLSTGEEVRISDIVFDIILHQKYCIANPGILINYKFSVNKYYHGSAGKLVAPIRCDVNKHLCDFGNGFYTGEYEMQARSRVSNEREAYINEVYVDVSNLDIYRITDLVEWVLFIGVNRGKIKMLGNYPKLLAFKEKMESHDIVYGLIADDKIANSYNMFLNNLITDKCLAECLSYVKYGNQYVLKTEKACRSARIGNSIPLDRKAKEEAKEWGRDKKQDMDKFLKEAQSKYRREGYFLDELLERYR